MALSSLVVGQRFFTGISGVINPVEFFLRAYEGDVDFIFNGINLQNTRARLNVASSTKTSLVFKLKLFFVGRFSTDLRRLRPIEDLRVSARLSCGSQFASAETIVSPLSDTAILTFDKNIQEFEPIFEGTIDGNILNVTSVFRGEILVGSVLKTNSLLAAGTQIVGLGTGSGGVGTYTINISQTRSNALYFGKNSPIKTFIEFSANNSRVFGNIRATDLSQTIDQRSIVTVPISQEFDGIIEEQPFDGRTEKIFVATSASASLDIFTTISIASEIQSRTTVTNARISVASERLLSSRLVATASVAEARLQGGVLMQAAAIAKTASGAILKYDYSVSSRIVALSAFEAFLGVFPPVFIVSNISAKTTPKVNLLVEKRISGRQLYINLNTREIVKSSVIPRPFTELEFTRHDIAAIDLQFIKNSQLTPLSSGATGRVGVKSQFTDEVLASDDSWQIVDVDEQTAYHFSLNLDTVGIEDLFPTNEEEFVMLKFEIEWSEAGTVNTTLPIMAKIYNDVLQ